MNLEPALTAPLRDGMSAAQARQFDRARALLEQASADSPNSARVWFWLAVASESSPAAIKCLRRTLEIDPAQAHAADALARLLVAEALRSAPSDRARARALLGEAGRVAPGLSAAWIALAAVSDAVEERLGALRRAISLDPHRADLRARFHDALLRQAVQLVKTANRTGARALFREAADLDPRDGRVWQALVRLADTPADTVHALRGLVRACPDQAGSRAALKKALSVDARALEAGGQKAEAQRRWRETIALDERDPESWLGLASVASNEGELRRAVETAHRLDPAHPKANEWLGRLQACARAAASPSAPATPAGRTVMVVDDSPTIRKILAVTLERAGYAVVAEPNGESALERLATLAPSLILLDITMPKIDGYEVCRRIRQDPRTAQVPVVMLSGKDGFFDKVKGRMVGATEYLTKPFEAPAVLAAIAKYCRTVPEVTHG